MQEYPRSTTWPYVVLVTGLFLYTVRGRQLAEYAPLERLMGDGNWSQLFTDRSDSPSLLTWAAEPTRSHPQNLQPPRRTEKPREIRRPPPADPLPLASQTQLTARDQPLAQPQSAQTDVQPLAPQLPDRTDSPGLVASADLPDYPHLRNVARQTGHRRPLDAEAGLPLTPGPTTFAHPATTSDRLAVRPDVALPAPEITPLEAQPDLQAAEQHSSKSGPAGNDTSLVPEPTDRGPRLSPNSATDVMPRSLADEPRPVWNLVPEQTEDFDPAPYHAGQPEFDSQIARPERPQPANPGEPIAEPEPPAPPKTLARPPIVDDEIDPAERVVQATWVHEHLSALESEPALHQWSNSISDVLQRLAFARNLATADAQTDLQRLGSLIAAARSLDEQLGSDPQRLQLRQLVYGLRRRLLLWNELAQLDQLAPREPTSLTEVDRAAHQLARHLQQLGADRGWATFLALPQYSAIRTRPSPNASSQMASLAQTVNANLLDNQIDATQRAFLANGDVENWINNVSSWLPRRPYTLAFRQQLEQFEADPSAENGHTLAQSLAGVESLYAAQSAPLRTQFDTHYRNANFRLAVSSELINLVLPELSAHAEEVEDVILGARVQGQNTSWTRLQVRPVPDPQRLHLQLEATGRTESFTASTKGPVTLFSRANGEFLVEKHLLATPQGMSVTPAAALADSGAVLTGLRTQFDELPLVGWLIRKYAVQQHDDQRHLVRREVRAKIAQSAQQRLDMEVHQRLDRMEQRLDEVVVKPFHQIGVVPELLETSTTEQRLVLRGRLASPIQQASFTARPQALADSLLSVQVHESVWNNLVEQLHLDGRELTLGEAIGEFAQALHVDPSTLSEEIPTDVRIRFAHREPVRCRFDHGHIAVSIHIAELQNGRRKWQDFSVRAFYRADVSALDVALVRDGNIELISDQLGFRDRIAVRGIFTKIMSRNHKLKMLRDRVLSAPQLQSLVVTQMHIDHGWLGLSLGTQEHTMVATEQTPVLR